MLPRDIFISRHAAQRWAERIRGRSMRDEEAREDMVRCCEVASTTLEPPEWMGTDVDVATDGSVVYVMLGDDVALVVYPRSAPPMVATVMTPFDEGSLYAAVIKSRRHRARMQRKPPRPALRRDPSWKYRTVNGRRDRAYRTAA